MKLWQTLMCRLGSYRPVSCEWEGHVGVAESGIPPEYVCIYCGGWGYAPNWTDEAAEEYEECECNYSYAEHRKKCDV